MKTMADMRKEQDEEKKAKKEGKPTESYSGGEKSGMAVFNPDDISKEARGSGVLRFI